MRSNVTSTPCPFRLAQYSFFTLLIVSLFSSCNEGTDQAFELIQTPSTFDIHAITELNDKLYATSGDVWSNCDILTSVDKGKTWQKDSLTNRSIFDLSTIRGEVLGAGVGGYIYKGIDTLRFNRIGRWGIQRSIIGYDGGYISVGGKDFNKGYIYTLQSDTQIDTTFDIDHQLSDVAASLDGSVISVGYGIILKSLNGRTWRRIDQDGDNFSSVAVNEINEFYTVGLRGSILKSIDSGETWKKIQNGHHPLASNPAFRKIFFEGTYGYIVGDKGIIWLSSDHGETWSDHSISKNHDLSDATVIDNLIICTSKNGKIIRVEL